MHEISLVRSIFNTLQSEFTAVDLENLKKIHIKVGLLSNIEPMLMQNAFQAVTASEEKYQNVELHVETVPIEIFCNRCKEHSTIENYSFKCRKCGQPNNNVVKGTELLIHQVQFDD